MKNALNYSISTKLLICLYFSLTPLCEKWYDSSEQVGATIILEGVVLRNSLDLASITYISQCIPYLFASATRLALEECSLEVMMSINQPYSDMIFTGYKPFEFRKQILKEMVVLNPQEFITAYIYETKKNGGVGAVIGEVKIEELHMPRFGAHHVTDMDIKERNWCVKTLYLIWCKNRGVHPNLHDGWFKCKRFLKYQDEIGFGANPDFNYALMLGETKKYTNFLPINAFLDMSGEPLDRPPLNMMQVRRDPDFVTLGLDNKKHLPNVDKTGVWRLGLEVVDGNLVEHPICPFCSTYISVEQNQPFPDGCPICGAQLLSFGEVPNT